MAEFVKSSFDQQACLDIKVTDEAMRKLFQCRSPHPVDSQQGCGTK